MRYSPFHLHVIIATSMRRTDWLSERSLTSVYKQERLNPKEIAIIIVDDNKLFENNRSKELPEITGGVGRLRRDLNLSPGEFPTRIINNIKTRGNSGTGAWNTGIEAAYNVNPDGFVSILDDDDEYLPNHLENCLAAINHNPSLQAVFQRLVWRHEDGSFMNHHLIPSDLSPRNFFIGNPGVQGSNMFFKTKSLVEIGGFDENFPNTTDRELMIRFLWHLEKTSGLENSISVIENVGVVHHNHKMVKVNEDFTKKQMGLELFYRKFRKHFSEEDFEKSVDRARILFKFQYPSDSYA